MINIRIGDKEYKVKEARTQEELLKGLKGVKELSNNDGMLFYIPDNLRLCTFTMEDMEIPLDIVFINQDYKVVDIKNNCKPGDLNIVNSTKNMEENDIIAYVLEISPNSEVKVGDELDIDENGPVMKVLSLDGTSLMDLWGGERIFRRTFTKLLIQAVKKAKSLEGDIKAYESQCKVVGRKMFKEIKALDEREPEYVKNTQ